MEYVFLTHHDISYDSQESEYREDNSNNYHLSDVVGRRWWPMVQYRSRECCCVVEVTHILIYILEAEERRVSFSTEINAAERRRC